MGTREGLGLQIAITEASGVPVYSTEGSPGLVGIVNRVAHRLGVEYPDVVACRVRVDDMAFHFGERFGRVTGKIVIRAAKIRDLMSYATDGRISFRTALNLWWMDDRN